MAKFVTNSTGTKALRLEEIKILAIETLHPHQQGGDQIISGYNLEITVDYSQGGRIIFETGETIGAVQALAGPIMAALEA
jgi:hypothetical protein